MKKIALVMGLLVSTGTLTSKSAFSADFTMKADQPSTLAVDGCAADEVGYVSLKSSKDSTTGEYTLTAKCLDVVCAYTNETGWPFGNAGKWTVKLLAKTEEKRGPLSDPQFDRSNVKIIKTGIASKAERDSLIKELISKKACKAAYYDKYIPSV